VRVWGVGSDLQDELHTLDVVRPLALKYPGVVWILYPHFTYAFTFRVQGFGIGFRVSGSGFWVYNIFIPTHADASGSWGQGLGFGIGSWGSWLGA
jgi:hypothetical protein